MVMDANGMTFFSMGKSNEFWEITRISPGNNAKLGGSFAEIRNVCIFALPMRPELGVSVFRAGFRDWPRKGAYAGNNGLMAEWLGKGLQNLVQRFESASDLTKTPLQKLATVFCY